MLQDLKSWIKQKDIQAESIKSLIENIDYDLETLSEGLGVKVVLAVEKPTS